MKAFICTKQDWEYEVVDVMLTIEYDDGILKDYNIRGFDDFEWEKANEFSEELSKLLNVEFVGDRTDT